MQSSRLTTRESTSDIQVIKKFTLDSADHDFLLLIDVEMPTGSKEPKTFMSRKNSIISFSEREKLNF